MLYPAELPGRGSDSTRYWPPPTDIIRRGRLCAAIRCGTARRLPPLHVFTYCRRLPFSLPTTATTEMHWMCGGELARVSSSNSKLL